MDNRNSRNSIRSNRDAVRARNEMDTDKRIAELTEEVLNEGYDIEYGNIGTKTTYCLLTKGDEEIVGYTFIQNTRYLNEKVGRLKALQQAVTRKELLEERARGENN